MSEGASYWSASSGPSSPSSSPLSDASGDSMSSEQLDALLQSLNLKQPAGDRPRGEQATPRRRLVLSDSSDSEREGGTPSPQLRRSPRGHRSSAASDQGAALGRLHGSSPEAAAAALARPGRPDPSHASGALEVIDLLSSDSDGDAGGITIARPTTQRKRQVVDSEDSDSSPSPKRSPRPNPALPPFFAAISPLRSLQLNVPAQPPQPAPVPKPAATPAAATPARPAAARSSAAKPPQSAAAFKRVREQLTRQLFGKYNSVIFEGKLPADLEIRWNNRLSTTAGLTHYRRDIPPEVYEPPRYSARVELSSKVLDSQPKLERTLCHELCHVAAWLLDHTAKPPHGPMFKKWADRAMRVLPHLDITTCHSYQIFFPFRWQCSNAACGQTYGRHSNSIDVTKKVCGECKGRLLFLGKFQQDGTPAKSRAPSAYSRFVAEHFQAAKEGCPPGASQADVMKVLAERWAAQQKQAKG